MTETILKREELQTLLEHAAELGAKRALESVGLHDSEASNDIRDMRGLLESYRTVKTSLLATIGKAVAVAILALLAFNTGINWEGGK